jgi:hypothetical protein
MLPTEKENPHRPSLITLCGAQLSKLSVPLRDNLPIVTSKFSLTTRLGVGCRMPSPAASGPKWPPSKASTLCLALTPECFLLLLVRAPRRSAMVSVKSMLSMRTVDRRAGCRDRPLAARTPAPTPAAAATGGPSAASRSDVFESRRGTRVSSRSGPNVHVVGVLVPSASVVELAVPVGTLPVAPIDSGDWLMEDRRWKDSNTYLVSFFSSPFSFFSVFIFLSLLSPFCSFFFFFFLVSPLSPSTT